MRSFIISSALLVILAQCGYPVADNAYPTTPSYPTPPPSYPLPKKYPVPPAAPTYSAAPASLPASLPSSTDESSFFSEEESTTSATSEFRKRAKARTAHNRQFQRRALQPIRRFQQRKQ
ncbi:hypothetical protein L5515_006252 [Caenorhabditis briggsae]|uniref:Uncharacterized protein n=1 Tax=Caenorhabditis briggsae TaxID=6238 RepID=A0AAE9F077_CAEBR|nr:hypothetical protein L5515_006252 [Caenorhabditis briggsae]